MELDNFDLIINLVALGMGVSLVPIRALSFYPRKKAIQRVALSARFERQIIVVARRQRHLPPHLADFIGNILF